MGDKCSDVNFISQAHLRSSIDERLLGALMHGALVCGDQACAHHNALCAQHEDCSSLHTLITSAHVAI